MIGVETSEPSVVLYLSRVPDTSPSNLAAYKYYYGYSNIIMYVVCMSITFADIGRPGYFEKEAPIDWDVSIFGTRDIHSIELSHEFIKAVS